MNVDDTTTASRLPVNGRALFLCPRLQMLEQELGPHPTTDHTDDTDKKDEADNALLRQRLGPDAQDLLDGSPASHASTHARPHTQAHRTDQLKPAAGVVSHEGVRHETSPPLNPTNPLNLPSAPPCNAFRLLVIDSAVGLTWLISACHNRDCGVCATAAAWHGTTESRRHRKGYESCPGVPALACAGVMAKRGHLLESTAGSNT